jgi:hypothetical protein
MRRITALVVSLVLVLAGCGGDGGETASAEEPTTTTQAAQEPTTTSQPAAQAVEAVDAKVVFDGEKCSYLGPAVIPAGTEVNFEFDDSAHPAALVVLHVEDGTTWDQVVESTGPGTARMTPPWVVSYRVQVETGTLVTTVEQGDYLVACNTAPDDTDAVYPAVLIEVIEG